MKKILRRIRSIFVVLKRQGPSYTIHLIYIYTVLPCLMIFLPRLLLLSERIQLKIDKHLFLNQEYTRWRRRKNQILRYKVSGYLIRTNELGLPPEQCNKIRKLQETSNEVVIAEIDQDGFYLSHFGVIKGLPMTSNEEFLKRNRFILKMVALTGYIGIKKNYGENKFAFINELKTLHCLRSSGCNLPSIMDVDFDNLTLTVSYIPGLVLREDMAKKASSLRDRETKAPLKLSSSDNRKEWLRRIHEGKRVIYDVVDSEFVDNLFEEMRKLHQRGFLWNDIKYGNVIIEKKSKNPYIFDFDSTRHHSSLPKSMFNALRDQEVELFNLHFGTKRMTFQRMKEELKTTRKNKTYSPVYFCAGLRMGDLWKTEVGYGRWHYILKQNLPIISGKRILDLGANNAFYSIQMLRNGAKEALGIELNQKNIEQGLFIKRGFEWIDEKKYNLKYIHGNMKDILNMDIGKFDIVMALCCIYYMDDDSIADLIQHISTITDIFIVQCNTEINIGRSDPYTYEKASIEYNLRVIKENGFPFIRVIAPDGYSRPLLIARKG